MVLHNVILVSLFLQISILRLIFWDQHIINSLHDSCKDQSVSVVINLGINDGIFKDQDYGSNWLFSTTKKYQDKIM